jgi:hypothetical protein
MASILTSNFSTGLGHESESDRSSQDGRPRSPGTPPSSPPGSPRQQDFAPRGPVKIRGLRNSIPMNLQIDVGGVSKLAKNIRLEDIHGAYSVSITTPQTPVGLAPPARAPKPPIPIY